MTVQLTFDGNSVAAGAQERKGAIGKVERCLFIRPWLSCGEIAKCIAEPSARVSNALNVLMHEGRARQEKGHGPRGGAVWASTDEGLIERNDARLAEMKAERMGRDIARGLVATPVDWRPTETIPEDYYAL